MTARKKTARANLDHMSSQDLVGVKAYLQRWMDAATQAKSKAARAIPIDPTDSSLEGYRYWKNVESGFKLVLHDITNAIAAREGEASGNSGRRTGRSQTVGSVVVEGTAEGNDTEGNGNVAKGRSGRKKSKPK